MSNFQQPPTTANLFFFAGKIGFAALFRLLSAPVRWMNWNGAPVLFKDVVFAAIRCMVSNLTIAQARYLYKSTSETYEAFCKKTNQEPKTLKLGDGDATAHWIGEEDADTVILYPHGGGYTQPCTIEHMQYLNRLVKDINKDLSDSTASTSISVLLLAYTLAPEVQFPEQLKQASTMLSHLLHGGKRASSNILIGGDSAGGNLALSLLSHLRHPHLDIPSVPLSVPLRGVFLFSPWVSFDTSHDSFARNAGKDFLVANMLRKWAGMFLGTVNGEIDPGVVAGGNNYSEPLLANASWWEGMHKIVGCVWMYGGEDEIFIDSQRAFASKFLEGWKSGGGLEENVVFDFATDNAHIGPILDVMLQYEEKTGTQLGFEKWLKGSRA